MTAPGTESTGGRAPGPARLTIGALLIGVGLIVLGAFLPWVWSGASGRSSFAMVRSADRLGIVDDGTALVALRSWYLVPLLAAVVIVLTTIHRPRAAAIVGVVLAGVVGAIALLVLVAGPDTGAGPMTSIIGAAMVVAASIALLRPRGRGAVAPS